MYRYTINDENIEKFGKIKEINSEAELITSGSFLEFGGEFTRVTARIEGEAEKDLEAYLGVFINEEKIPEQIFKIENGIHVYTLFQSRQKENVTVRAMKLTELQYGKLKIKELNADGKMSPAKEKENSKRKMLFIGDSLTAGYGVEGKAEDFIFTTATENVTKTYSYLTAEAFGAQAWFACFSGGGIISRYIAPEEEKPLTDILMPEVLEQSMDNEYEPDIIFMNLGTNDASYTRKDKNKEEAFAGKYMEFVHKIAEKYPKSYILILYGLMEATLTKAVKNMAEICQKNKIRCSFVELPLMEKEDGVGTGGHPSFTTHKKIAQILVREVADIMDWKEE